MANQYTIPVTLQIGDKAFKAELNNSIPAHDVLFKLPNTVGLDKYEFDYCGVIPEPLAFDESDKQNGWTNGDICLADNFYSLLYSDEEQSASQTGLIKIGELKEGFSEIKNLGPKIQLTIRKI